MKGFLLFGVLLAAVSSAHAAVQGREVSYEANGTKLKGYVAWDDAVSGKRPGVLVVHEWWGNNDYSRKRARMLAEQGYTALALDMYGEGRQAHNPDEAQKLSGEVGGNDALARARFEAALAQLKQEKTVDPDNVGAIGYCFGGGVVLNMARMGEPLKVVESFHGGLATKHPAETGKVKARVASYTGEADSMIPADQVAAFRKEMAGAGVSTEIVTYPGALHAFSNPDADQYAKQFKLPIAYDAKADQDSWSRGLAFLAAAFKAK